MHPVLTVFIVAALLVLCAWLLLRLAKFIGQVLGRLFPRPRPNEE
jgi:small neutral amino acid transporter SnatA (MarC family)